MCGWKQVLSRNLKDDNLRRWFGHIATEIDKLKPDRPISTGRKIQQLVAALEEVEQFHQVPAVAPPHAPPCAPPPASQKSRTRSALG